MVKNVKCALSIKPPVKIIPINPLTLNNNQIPKNKSIHISSFWSKMMRSYSLEIMKVFSLKIFSNICSIAEIKDSFNFFFIISFLDYYLIKIVHVKILDNAWNEPLNIIYNIIIRYQKCSMFYVHFSCYSLNGIAPQKSWNVI